MTEIVYNPVIVKGYSFLKDRFVWIESYTRTVLIGFTGYSKRNSGLTTLKLDVVDLTLFVNFRNHMIRKCVYNRRTHAVQTRGNLVAATAELTTSVEHRQNGFQSGQFCFWMNIDRNTTTIVIYPTATIGQKRNAHLRSVSCNRFID